MKWFSENRLNKLISYKSTRNANECPICFETLEDDDNIFVCHNVHKYHKHCIGDYIGLKLRNDMDWKNVFYPTFKCPLSRVEYTCDELVAISEHIISSANGDYIQFNKPGSSTNYQTFSVWKNKLDGLYNKAREFKNGAVLYSYYKGPMGDEYMITAEKYKEGMIEYHIEYQGPKGSERKVEKETVICTQYYEGQKGMERRVRAEIKETAQNPYQIQYFQGEKNHESIVKIVEPSANKTCFYEGMRGQERKVKCEYPDRVDYYEGERFHERLVRTEKKD